MRTGNTTLAWLLAWGGMGEKLYRTRVSRSPPFRSWLWDVAGGTRMVSVNSGEVDFTVWGSGRENVIEIVREALSGLEAANLRAAAREAIGSGDVWRTPCR